MENDAKYLFLKDTSPFTMLKEDLLRKLASKMTEKSSPAGHVLYVQGQDQVHELHMIRKGSVKLVDERSQSLYDTLTEGDIFGGVAMLMKNSLAFRTMATQEDTHFYLLPEEDFMEVCDAHPEFAKYFAQTLSIALTQKGRLYKPDITPNMNLYSATMEKIGRDPVTCPAGTSIKEAAAIMSERDVDYILVANEQNKPVGIVTDKDLRKKVVQSEISRHDPISKVMNSPLQTVPHSTLEVEGLMSMITEARHHLVITKNGKVVAVATHDDFMVQQGLSPVSLASQIDRAKKPKDLADLFAKIPVVVHSLIQGGLHAENISKVISALNDQIMHRVLKLAEEEMDSPAPLDYCFVVLGSEGRQEQTFKTDQDNAIIRAESPPGQEEAVEAWFATFAKKVCGWLDQVGFPYCPGDIMAQNPKWNQTLKVWKQYFTHWVMHPTGEEILNSSIFFDFRPVYGNFLLASMLREHLFGLLDNQSAIFFTQLAQNAARGNTPLSFFRTFVVEKDGEHKSELDLKHKGTAIVVDIARLFALKYHVSETNTIDRIQEVRQMGNLLSQSDDLMEAYHFLMQLRLGHQIEQALNGEAPSNYINPEKLTQIDKKVLKESFQVISHFQEMTLEKFGGIR